ncbi:MAG: dihydrofolate reductase [Candidatus Cloacimonadia bacterium]
MNRVIDYKKQISIVVAVAEKDVIGCENKMPWDLPADLNYFKNLTLGNIVVMGRKTYESINQPLPGRINIVITTRKIKNDVITVKNIDEFFELIEQQSELWSDKEIFIIGGTAIYKAFLPCVDTIYRTRIYAEFEGDTFFPLIDEKEWYVAETEKGIRDDNNCYDYEFQVLKRRDQ